MNRLLLSATLVAATSIGSFPAASADDKPLKGDLAKIQGQWKAMVGPEKKDSKWSVYRFHLDSPIPFMKSLRATIEHGRANDRGDNFSSVAYWYQIEPHAEFPALPPAGERLLRVP